MTEYLGVAQGHQPWKPGPDVQTVEVFDYYDMPTTGALRQQGVLYLFWCIEGHVQDINVWVYALVQEDELSGLYVGGDFAGVALRAGQTTVDNSGLFSLASPNTCPHRAVCSTP